VGWDQHYIHFVCDVEIMCVADLILQNQMNLILCLSLKVRTQNVKFRFLMGFKSCIDIFPAGTYTLRSKHSASVNANAGDVSPF
jgi:hypothetical protein